MHPGGGDAARADGADRPRVAGRVADSVPYPREVAMYQRSLEPGSVVIADVGHSGGISAIVPTAAGVVSAADDGYLYLRDTAGMSVRPPLHLPEITCVVPVPGSTLAVVGAADGAYGVDLPTLTHLPLTGFDDHAAVTCGAQVGGDILVGLSDGRIRRVLLDGGTEVVASFEAPVDQLAATPASEAFAVGLLDGGVGLVVDGELVWGHLRRPGAVRALTMTPSSVVAAGSLTEAPGLEPTRGTLEVLGLDGTTLATLPVEAPVLALAAEGCDVVVGCLDGSVWRLDADHTGLTLLGRLEADPGISHVALVDGEVWVGTAGGHVHRLDPPLALPARSSGALAVTADPGTDLLAMSDGWRVRWWNLSSLAVGGELVVDGVVALTVAPSEGRDLVLAYADGRVERRTGTGYTEVAAAAALPFRPAILGVYGDVVVAADDDGPAMLDAATLAETDLSDDELTVVNGVERTSFWFTGRGVAEGIEVAVIDGRELIVRWLDLLTVTDGALHQARVWDGETWVG